MMTSCLHSSSYMASDSTHSQVSGGGTAQLDREGVCWKNLRLLKGNCAILHKQENPVWTEMKISETKSSLISDRLTPFLANTLNIMSGVYLTKRTTKLG